MNAALKTTGPPAARLPGGCFTVAPNGAIIASTLPQSFPAAQVQRIAERVLSAFRTAQEAQLLFAEIQIHYPALKLTARDLRGGAIVFLSPQPPA